MKNYDFKANELELNEYELTILKMYNDMMSYVDSLSEEQKRGFKIGFLSSLVCLKEVDEKIESSGILYGFGTDLKIEACVYNLISDKDVASFMKSAIVMHRLNDYLEDEE